MIQEHLTLDHLAPYLPHKLDLVAYQSNGEIERLLGLTQDSVHTTEDEYLFDSVAPLLHPLSSILDEIEHFGEKVILINKITGRWPNGVVTNEDALDIWVNRGITNILRYETIQMLLKHHIDVFGLIDKGLAEAIKLEK